MLDTRIKGTVRFYDAARKIGSIVARSTFYLVNSESAHCSTARQFRPGQQVEFTPSQHSGEPFAEQVSID